VLHRPLGCKRAYPVPNHFEDVRHPDGEVERRHRNIRLGTLEEFPTKGAARKHLATLLKEAPPKMEMSFRELAERWEKAEGSTMKGTTLHHYKNALRAYVLPKFGDRKIAEINREDIQTFLAEKARKYSESTLRSMRVVLGLTLGWATNCNWLEKNPCSRVKRPKRTAGRRVKRTFLTAEQVNAMAGRLKEPYATLVLFLAATGLRIGEALAIKWTDFEYSVLHVTRRICDGDVDEVKSRRSERRLPIDPILMTRMEKLGKGEWVFGSRKGTSLNQGNALSSGGRMIGRRHVLKSALSSFIFSIGACDTRGNYLEGNVYKRPANIGRLNVRFLPRSPTPLFSVLAHRGGPAGEQLGHNSLTTRESGCTPWVWR
jgi:integrase